MYKSLIIISIFLFCSCKDNSVAQNLHPKTPISDSLNIGNTKSIIETRFEAPFGFVRSSEDYGSFGQYLRSLELLPENSLVRLYDGSLKYNQEVHAAILDISVGTSNLQQCADAVMRLRAEYLYANKRYEEISFNFTNGWKAEYMTWRAGNNIIVDGNRSYWKTTNDIHTSRVSFERYLQKVFMYAGTYSLSKEMNKQSLKNISIGDVFIKGGFPGHAVIVVDKAINEETGEIVVMLAQSYMPAQQVHILKNFNNTKISPWYSIKESNPELITPEWTFTIDQLKRF